MQADCSNSKKLLRLTQILFIYTLLVILWGAWVRISHSGDGCGDTWPLCGGKLIPEAERGKTWVEYGHRLMSGVYGILVAYFWWQFKKSKSVRSLAKLGAKLTLIFMITEALLGAKLVLFGLVASNDTPFRALVMALHQVNSLILSGSIVICWLALVNPTVNISTKKIFSGVAALIGLFAITGAWASLSTTLFPSESLLSGITNDFSSDSHYLVRLRVLHPILAITVGLGMLSLFWKNANSQTNSDTFKKVSNQTAFMMLIAIGFGASTLLALSPAWMKLTHLGLAHVIWALCLRWTFYRLIEKTHN